MNKQVLAAILSLLVMLLVLAYMKGHETNCQKHQNWVSVTPCPGKSDIPWESKNED